MTNPLTAAYKQKLRSYERRLPELRARLIASANDYEETISAERTCFKVVASWLDELFPEASDPDGSADPAEPGEGAG